MRVPWHFPPRVPDLYAALETGVRAFVNDQKIDVAVFVGVPIGIRAKKNHLLRIELVQQNLQIGEESISDPVNRISLVAEHVFADRCQFHFETLLGGFNEVNWDDSGFLSFFRHNGRKRKKESGVGIKDTGDKKHRVPMTTEIPLVLDGFGLVAGSVLDFTEEEGKILVRKVIRENPISAWRGKGKLPSGLSVDEYLRRARDGE
jgi:hypothetical protein